jgi:hypothetical protein
VTLRLGFQIKVLDGRYYEPVLRFVSRLGRPSAITASEVWTDSAVNPEFGEPDAFSGPLWLTSLGAGIGEVVLGQFRQVTTVQVSEPAPLAGSDLDRLTSPFFYADEPTSDAQHTFFVEPRVTAIDWREYDGPFVSAVTNSPHTVESLTARAVEAVAAVPVRMTATGPVVASPEPVDPVALYALRRPGDWALGDDRPLQVGDRVVTIDGRLDSNLAQRRRS